LSVQVPFKKLAQSFARQYSSNKKQIYIKLKV